MPVNRDRADISLLPIIVEGFLSRLSFGGSFKSHLCTRFSWCAQSSQSRSGSGHPRGPSD